MAHVQCQMRPENKEPQPEWSSICNNVFDQYLDGDDPFDFDAVTHERSSSNDSSALFNFSGGSEQSNVTGGTSPIPAWGESVVQSIEAPDGQAARLQPEPKAPVDFWARTLKALEQNAAASEKQQRQQVLRTAKSHPDFLSLGGHPSPPAIPVSTPSQTLSVQRQRHRMPARPTSNRNTTRQPSAVRSVSRGRLLGVAKTGGSSSNRKISLSPTKMMTPSRYRAASRTGFRDVWAQRVVSGMDKHDIRVPTLMHQGLPVSPPHSGHLMQEDEFAVFGSPERGYAGNGYYDDQMSPLAVNFQQQARLHTPARSPMLSPRSRDVDGYFVEPVPQIPPNPYMPQTVPLNDTTPLYPERTSSLAPNRLQAFDFGFSSPHEELDAWGAASFSEPTSHPYYHREHFSQQADPFVGAENPVPGSPVFESAGLGISCDPSLVSNFTAVTNNSSVPTEMYQPPQALMTPYHVPTQASKTEPNTPHNHRRRHARSRCYAGSPSPSPTPTAPRSRQRSSSRRAVSRHRRTKSSTVTPRQAQNGASSQQGGFVNYTPNDKGKILNGVAPSGSSKTKARREKEAADKRRKFSQAAAQAVLELGGDLDSLAKAGLLAS